MKLEGEGEEEVNIQLGEVAGERMGPQQIENRKMKELVGAASDYRKILPIARCHAITRVHRDEERGLRHPMANPFSPQRDASREVEDDSGHGASGFRQFGQHLCGAPQLNNDWARPVNLALSHKRGQLRRHSEDGRRPPPRRCELAKYCLSTTPHTAGSEQKYTHPRTIKNRTSHPKLPQHFLPHRILLSKSSRELLATQ